MLLVRAKERVASDETQTVMARTENWKLSFVVKILSDLPCGYTMKAKFFSGWASPATISPPVSAELVSRSTRWAVQDQACCCPNTSRYTAHSVFRVAPSLFPDHTMWALKALILCRNGNRFLLEARTFPHFLGIPLICWRLCFGWCLKPTLIS